MSDIDKLVENYFAPRPKTLTKQMLYEMFSEVLREQEENNEVYNNALKTLLNFIQKNGFDKAQKHEDASTTKTIVITNAGGRPDRDHLIKQMDKQEIVEPNRKIKKTVCGFTKA